MTTIFRTMLLGAALAGATAPVGAAEPARQGEQVIQPEVERRALSLPRIDTEDFEIGAFIGVLSIEDFGSNAVSGLRGAYHVSEDLFVEMAGAASRVSDKSFRDIGLRLFETEEVDLYYYNISLGYNFLPGEIFVTRNWSLTSALYLIGGIGITNFNDEDFFTVNVGVGVRMLLADWLAFHIDMRDHLFNSDILGRDKLTHNFELHTGLTVFF
jgi:outer membrane beta-barrel protein